MELKTNMEINFKNAQHRDFYFDTVARLDADVYLRAFIYTIGISDITRNKWECFYDEKAREINLNAKNHGWQTSSTLRITRLAFQLFTDSTPTAVTFDENDNRIEDFQECQQYSVSDIFCCEYAKYYVEALKIRYPEYF